MTPEDKRRAFRLRKDLPIRYELRREGKYANAALGGPPKSGVSTLTQDISEGGVRIITDGFIPRLSRMILHINMADGKLIEANSEVKWTTRIPHSYRYQLGLEFKDIDTRVKIDIAKFVAINK